MLKRIHINGFKSLRDVSIDQLTPLVVVFGPNAAGKSNFLEAMLLLSRLVGERTLGQAFEAPMRGYPTEQFSLPLDGLSGLLTADDATLSLEADVAPAKHGRSRAPDPIRYRIQVGIRPRSGALTVIDEYLTKLKKIDFLPKGTPRIEQIDDHLVVRQSTGAARPRHEPIGLSHSLASDQQLDARRFPDLALLRAELRAWTTYYLDPRVAMRSAQPPRQVSDIGSRGEFIAPFLYRLKESQEHKRRFSSIGRALHSAIPTIDSLDVELDPKRGTLDIVVDQEGTPFSTRVISEGTLRILALCAIAANPWPGTLVAFEEPENGVHPQRIDVIAKLLHTMALHEDRQVIVNSHSPSLIASMLRLSREAPDLVTVLRCTRDNHATVIHRFNTHGPVFDHHEIQDGLASPDDGHLLEAMLVRGWLDG